MGEMKTYRKKESITQLFVSIKAAPTESAAEDIINTALEGQRGAERLFGMYYPFRMDLDERIDAANRWGLKEVISVLNNKDCFGNSIADDDLWNIRMEAC
ncbi:MAG: hypothetical protein U1D67_06730 [Dehalococcoidia bacterium]|nr:hypothetical protein [Dehalococcoidia bacterium]